MTEHEQATGQPDAELLATVADFHKDYKKARAAHEKWIAEKARVESLPDCPPDVLPADDPEGYDRRKRFLAEHDIDDLCDLANAFSLAQGHAAGVVFGLPAQTVQGALEKLKIVHMAIGDGSGMAESGDHDLEVFQDTDDLWMANVVRDLERLAGGEV